MALVIEPTAAPADIRHQTRLVGSPGCAQLVTGSNAAEVDAAVGRADPGAVVCVGPGNYGSQPIEVRRSGRRDAPLELRAMGQVVVGGIRVRANHVSITGFEVTPGASDVVDGTPDSGISLRGRRLEVSDNVVHDTLGSGISCEDTPPSCVETVIARNTVRRADGTGIVVFGRDNLVEGNEVAESLRVRASDADGVRFFGRGHVLRSNWIHDISDKGYLRDPPHTDCFQTFDNGRPPTVGTVIDGNICENVDHQCLIAQALRSGKSRSIRFTNNVCRNGGSQGLLIERFPEVVVAFNAFAETIQYRAAIFRHDSSGGAFINNIVDGPYRAYELDASSRSDWRTERNLRAAERSAGSSKQTGVKSVPLSVAGPEVPLPQRYLPAPGSPVIDAGVAVQDVDHDALGVPRPCDRDRGSAHPDVGPYEHCEADGTP
jgi:hypothetical protein